MFITHNETMMQYFEWYLPNDGLWWKRCAAKAESLHALGITQVWLPPAYKGSAGAMDVGYGVYDMYDLGEFNQKGSVRTKYGTAHEYLAAVRQLRLVGIQTLGDVVLNHRLGADEAEDVRVIPVNPDNRLEMQGEMKEGTVYTRFTFPGRGTRYSGFT
ncbi:MAG: alpha-amylase, partial [Oscillospiraceae bacterium]|nr:alpha-amylase [Oscillospiraceae bacterium]